MFFCSDCGESFEVEFEILGKCPRCAYAKSARGITPLASAIEAIQEINEAENYRRFAQGLCLQVAANLGLPVAAMVPVHLRLWYEIQMTLRVKRIEYHPEPPHVDEDYWDYDYDPIGDDDHRDNGHSQHCLCQECRDEDALFECGQLPDHLGGGCQLAGTEFCDWDCPIGRSKVADWKNDG
jgi:hypothetical protein